MKKKFIGVLGGMGPNSSVLFYKKLIEQCQKQYGAKYDNDFPKILIYNLPTPGGIEGTRKEKYKLLKVLVEGAKYLQSCGVDFIVMPCNSTHYFFEELHNSISIPILNIVEETAKKLSQRGIRKLDYLQQKLVLKIKSIIIF